MKATENHEKLVSLITQSKEKSIADDGNVTPKDKGSVNNGGTKTSKIHGDALDEFRLSGKEVELPMFTGEDPARWIARAEVYFRVQDTNLEINVSLTQLYMGGATIHFFKALMEEDETLSWEKLKDSLLERYGGISDGSVFDQLVELHQEEERGGLHRGIRPARRSGSAFTRGAICWVLRSWSQGRSAWEGEKSHRPRPPLQAEVGESV